jgi:hypothetical protein
MERMKTRKVAGVDLNASCFLLVQHENEPSTWKLPVHVPGDTQRTINLVKNSVYRWNEIKGIPAGKRSALWNRLIGCCLALGIKVQTDPVVTATPEEIDLILAERAANNLVGKLNLDWTKE